MKAKYFYEDKNEQVFFINFNLITLDCLLFRFFKKKQTFVAKYVSVVKPALTMKSAVYDYRGWDSAVTSELMQHQLKPIPDKRMTTNGGGPLGSRSEALQADISCRLRSKFNGK